MNDDRFKVQRWISPTGDADFQVLFERRFEKDERDPDWDPVTAPEATMALGGERAIVRALGLLKSGKEATVWVCTARFDAGERLVAAKWYKDIETRGFRHDSLYQQGRWNTTRREYRALKKGSAFGKAMQQGAWSAREFRVLAKLHAAGADVPKPLRAMNRCVFMEWIGDDTGPAPLLARVRQPPVDPPGAFRRVLHNIRLMLRHDLVHGDLSAFNILWHDGRPVIIDVPQAIDIRARATNAFDLFARDVDRVCMHFARWGVTSDPAALAGSMWDDWTRGRLG